MPPRLTWPAIRAALPALCLLVISSALVIQTARIEGLKIWPIDVTGWKQRALEAEQALSEVERVQDQARDLAESARRQAEASYRDLAKRIDDDSQQALGDAMVAADRHIASHRVRLSPAGSAAGATTAAAPDQRAGSAGGGSATAELDDPDGLADGADWVAVTADDVRICTENTLKAEAAHAWATGLEQTNP